MEAVHRGSARQGGFTLARKTTRKEETRVVTLQLSAWYATALKTEDPKDNLLQCDFIRSGVGLCQMLEQIDGSPNIKYNKAAKPDSFHARENIEAFVAGALEMGVSRATMFEVEDLLQGRHIRNVLYFILHFAREAYLKFGFAPPEIVAAGVEIDKQLAQEENMEYMATIDFPKVEKSLDHKEYIPIQGNALDEWIGEYCNENAVPVTATPAPLPLGDGQYIFPAEDPPFVIFHVRMFYGTPMYRVKDGWEEFASLIDRKMEDAFKDAAAYAMVGKKHVPGMASIDEDSPEEKKKREKTSHYEAALAAQADGALTVEVLVDSPPGKLYESIVWSVQDWWTVHTTYQGIPAEQGNALRVLFGERGFHEMRIVSVAKTPEETPFGFISWRLTNSTVSYGNASGPLISTTMNFIVNPAPDNKSTLLFVHKGVTPSLAGFDEFSTEISNYLKISLKRFVEKGIAFPFPWVIRSGRNAHFVPDKASKVCLECGKKFTFTNRRHHCRKCGNLVCNACSKHRMPVENYEDMGKVRVCSACQP